MDTRERERQRDAGGEKDEDSERHVNKCTFDCIVYLIIYFALPFIRKTWTDRHD